MDILRWTCLKFKRVLWNSRIGDGGRGVNPFQSSTIASVCNDVFKTKFLPEDEKILVKEDELERCFPQQRRDGRATVMHRRRWIPREDLGLKVSEEKIVSIPIACRPPKGYHSHVNYTKKSIALLEWFRHCARAEGRNLDNRHALTGRGE